MKTSLPVLIHILQSLIIREYNMKQKSDKIWNSNFLKYFNSCFLKASFLCCCFNLGPHKETINVNLHEKNCFTEFFQLNH